MGSDSKHVEFTFKWTLPWVDYDRIDDIGSPQRYFVTSFKNVSFRWYATMYAAEDASKISFFVYYDDGPLVKISGVEYNIGVVKSDQSLCGIRSMINNVYLREYMRLSTTDFGAWGWKTFEDKNSTDVRSKYGLNESDSLTIQVTIKIPMETFAYCIPSPAPAPSTPWAITLFNSSINNAEDNSWLCDTKVAGRDDVIFNCHKVYVAAQSKALETIFRYPPTQESSEEAALEEEQSVANPKKRKASAMDQHSTTAIQSADVVYTFPNLTAASLKAVLEYLYTGKATTTNLTMTEVIEMGDAGEQYDLKILKKFCAAELWKRIGQIDPVLAFEIARFADLHDEMKYLKHRALDVIAVNYEYLGVKSDELAKRFGGTRGKELRDELTEYMERLLRPKIDESID